MFQVTPVVRNLLIINIVVFALQNLLKGIDLTAFLALWTPGSENFRPYQFFTYMFAHGGLGHVFFNMLGLVIFGPMLERIWGARKFVTFYLVTGVGAALIYTGIDLVENTMLKGKVDTYLAAPTPDNFTVFVDDVNGYLDYYSPEFKEFAYELMENYSAQPESASIRQNTESFAMKIYNDVSKAGSMIGASGAIYGILMAFGMLFPNTQLMLLFPPIPIKAKYLVLIMGGYAIYAGFQRNPGDPTAHFAHLGGMIFAFIMLKYWQTKRDSFY